MQASDSRKTVCEPTGPVQTPVRALVESSSSVLVTDTAPEEDATQNVAHQLSIEEPAQASNTNSAKWKPVIIVVASFTMIFTCCGLNFAFGVFQALYESMAQEEGTPFTGATPAQIDLIGTISIALMTITGPFVVAWAKRTSPRAVSLAGSVVFALSLELASFGTKLWHFELTQGLLLGLGTSCCYMVAVTIAPTWFTARRGLATGIILSGTGIGGLVWAPALTALVDRIGFRNTLRLGGAVSFVLVAAGSAAMAWEPTVGARIAHENKLAAQQAAANGSRLRHSILGGVALVDFRVARSRKFLAQALGAIFQSAAYYTPVFFFASYASTLGYGAAAGAGFIAISNACNAAGKIVIGHAADRWGRLNTLVLTTGLSALATLAFWVPSTTTGFPGAGIGSDNDDGYYGDLAKSRGLFITFAVTYGIFASAYVSLFPTSIVELFGVQNFASVNGVLYMMRGLATLIGTPVGGALIRGSGVGVGPRAYEGMAALVGVLLCAATVSVSWVRVEAMIGPDGVFRGKWRL